MGGEGGGKKKPEKALPKRKGDWKARGDRVTAGRSWATLAGVGGEGAEGPTASLNSLSTSTGRWPIMAARCRAQHPELGGPAEPSGERSRGENATSSALTQKPAVL